MPRRGSAIDEYLADFENRMGGTDPFNSKRRHEEVATAIMAGQMGYAQGIYKNRVISIGPEEWWIDRPPNLSRTAADAIIIDGTLIMPNTYRASPGYYCAADYKKRADEIENGSGEETIFHEYKERLVALLRSMAKAATK